MSEQEDPTAYLISFLTKYTLLLERGLLAVREGVVSTVQSIMSGVESISLETEQRKLEAEGVLEFTYIHPDAETEILIEDIQKVADEIFDKASGQQSADLMPGSSEVIVRNRIRRFSGKLSESQGKLSQFDNELTKIVFEVIGSLSSEDVIAQRLEHVIMSIKSLQTGLGYLLIDYDQRCRMEDVTRVTNDILSLTFRQYTTEDEKEVFRSIFPDAA